VTRGEQFLAEVRSWIGTPFHPQQAAKGKGCDCKGLLWGAARELGFPEAESFYATFTSYDLRRKHGIPPILKEGMAALFDPVTERQPGDILLLKQGAAPVHFAVDAGETAIHTQIGGKPWVKETKLRVLLAVFSLDSAWRWRNG
jgi:hypothetical protein